MYNFVVCCIIQLLLFPFIYKDKYTFFHSTFVKYEHFKNINLNYRELATRIIICYIVLSD